MSFNPSNEVEVEEIFSEDYINFLNELDVVPVTFNFNSVIDELDTVDFKNFDWGNPIEINGREAVVYDEDIYDFPQPEPKYFKVSPFELIPQKAY